MNVVAWAIVYCFASSTGLQCTQPIDMSAGTMSFLKFEECMTAATDFMKRSDDVIVSGTLGKKGAFCVPVRVN